MRNQACLYWEYIFEGRSNAFVFHKGMFKLLIPLILIFHTLSVGYETVVGNVFDGTSSMWHPDSRWNGVDKDFTKQWIQVDLGQRYQITTVIAICKLV